METDMHLAHRSLIIISISNWILLLESSENLFSGKKERRRK
jgi:hypothetical protein